MARAQLSCNLYFKPTPKDAERDHRQRSPGAPRLLEAVTAAA